MVRAWQTSPKFLTCETYREWQYLYQPDNDSASVNAQLERWIEFLSQWELAIMEGKEICVTGDINLNFLVWGNPNVYLTSHAKKLQPLVTKLFDQIIPLGFVQMVKKATRFMR